ncbi:MAG: helix-turn-helix domain-containing protein [Ilumatobacteraceae bacterium]
MQSVAIFVYDGIQSIDVTGPAEVLAGASQMLPAEERYDVTIVSLRGGTVSTQSAVGLDSSALDAWSEAHPGPVDTVIIPGGFGIREVIDDPEALAAVAALIDRSSRLVTVCSGALIAAATGALDGHRVTTHWTRAATLAEHWPAIEVDADPIFIRSLPSADRAGGREVWSSAGVTAGIDLTLALVEHDHSTRIAQTIARHLVMFLRRPGGQSQFAAPTWIRQASPGPIRRAQELVIDDPGADHRVGELARHVGMSERHFVRSFSREVGVSPARFVARIRVDSARQALESSTDTVDSIARRCGFGTAETMRRTLVRHIGVSPDDYRRRFRHQPESSLP